MNSLLRFLPVALLLATAGALWIPFETHDSIYESRASRATPAGEITEGFRLVQQVTPPELTSALTGQGDPCFAILFATYARTNRDSFLVQWSQDGSSQQWKISSGALDDNAYRFFCPEADFDLLRPYQLTIAGIDGKPNGSPTVWVHADTSFGTASFPGQDPGTKQSLKLKGVIRSDVDALRIAKSAHGTFLLGWICTVLIGLLALLYVPRDSSAG